MPWPVPGEQPKISWEAIPDNTLLLGMWPIGLRGSAFKKNGERYLPKKDRPAKNICMSEFSPCYANIDGVWHEIKG